MPEIRVTIPDQGSRENTLRAAFRSRMRLFEDFGAQASETSLAGINWLSKEVAYFELMVPSLEAASEVVQNTLVEGNPIAGAQVTEHVGGWGDPCLNCGNIAGQETPPICPSCGFQEISPCPYCEHLSSRTAYSHAEGQLLRCPNCNRRVTMHYNDPMFKSDGTYRTPIVLVEPAEARVGNENRGRRQI